MVDTLGTAAAKSPHSSIPDALRSQPSWSDQMVRNAGLAVVDVAFVTVGGGLGSFVMVDLLRIAGVPASQIKILTGLEYPWQNYEYLTAVSQIPLAGRLRSDSGSCPDNVWAFPSYALREAFSARHVSGFIGPLWNVLTDGVLCDYWTPKKGQMFAALQREADRIDYWSSLSQGQVTVVRKRTGGGYFTLLDPAGSSSPVAYRSRFVHLAVGYPGLRFLEDLQRYRRSYGDHHRVVHAYEPHEHVYEELNRRGGTVVVRGAGIAASQVLDRLICDRRRHGAATTIVHIFRTYIDGARGPSMFKRRRGGKGWAYQGFNCPKSTWGGQGRAQLDKLEGEARAQMLRDIAGTTTARRKGWNAQLEAGRREGFYRAYEANVDEVVPGPPGTVLLRLRPPPAAHPTVPTEPIVPTEPTVPTEPIVLAANFIIDTTGLVGDLSQHPVLADLLEHRTAARNPLGRLDVERSFELRGARSGPGRMYAAGAATYGSYLAGVDTFLGLQISALEATDDLAAAGFCERIGIARSMSQWWKWIKGRQP